MCPHSEYECVRKGTGSHLETKLELSGTGCDVSSARSDDRISICISGSKEIQCVPTPAKEGTESGYDQPREEYMMNIVISA